MDKDSHVSERILLKSHENRGTGDQALAETIKMDTNLSKRSKTIEMESKPLEIEASSELLVKTTKFVVA